MAPARPGREAAAVWDIATPSRRGCLPGVSMAGFRQRTAHAIDLQVVPYPAVTLAFDLGDGRVVVEGPDRGPRRGSAVIGVAAGGVRVRGRDIEALQVRLSPLLAPAVLGGVAGSGGTVAALDDLWGRDAERIDDRVRAAASWDERFAVLEAELARRCRNRPAVDPEVAHAWRVIVAGRGQVRVDRLAAETGWSRKRLWARFRSQIGLTPKRAAQLVRFDHAAHRLAGGDRAAQVAAESGYADQSHLHRDALAFAGLTPAAVAVAPWLAVDDVAWAGGSGS